MAAQCTADSHCNPAGAADAGLCVDGYCCDSLCASQCQACDVPGNEGKCSTVGTTGPQPVHSGGLHPRTACAGGTSECAGACAGNPNACTYPDGGTTDDALDCVEDGGVVVKTTYPCNGAGSDTPTTGDCNGFRCKDAHACLTVCGKDGDCVTNDICVFTTPSSATGSCQPLTGPLCDGKVTLRRTVQAGGNEVCPNDFACPAGATACNTSCVAVQDCAAGFVCTEQHVCVPPLQAPALPSCSMSRAGSEEDGAPLAWLGAMAVGFALKRRRR